MPGHDDEGPRNAELFRIISDFRAEFREAMGKMVRADVYLADVRTIDVRLTAQAAEIQRIDSQQKDERNDRRTLRNIAITALLGAMVAVATALLK